LHPRLERCVSETEKTCANNGTKPAKLRIPRTLDEENKNGKGDRKMKTTITMLTLLCVAASAQQKGSFTDSRDKKTYKTVKIGEQTWMAENLNYNASGSKCYDNKPANCDKYGRLYNLETAMKACPKFYCWHLPSYGEWGEAIFDDGGGNKRAGKYLKATSGWNYDELGWSGNGTDYFGFAALPGGYGRSLGSSYGVGILGMWWTASEYSTDCAYEDYSADCSDYRTMYYKSADMDSNSRDKTDLISVRCVQD